MNTLISSKFSGDYGRNRATGEHWLEEPINRRAREKTQWKYEGYTYGYDLFDREGYIAACLEAGRPIVITWVPSSIKLNCRDHQDIFGIPDILGIEEIPTLFTDVKGMASFRIFLIPYLLTGYDIPEKLERDEEPLVPFTAKTLSMLKEIEGGGSEYTRVASCHERCKWLSSWSHYRKQSRKLGRLHKRENISG